MLLNNQTENLGVRGAAPCCVFAFVWCIAVNRSGRLSSVVEAEVAARSLLIGVTLRRFREVLD